MHAIGKAGGENNQPRHKSHKCIKQCNAHGLTGQRKSIRHVTAENFYRRNTEG